MSYDRFKIFDFTVDDHRAEEEAKKSAEKFGLSKSTSKSPLDKYVFLRHLGRTVNKGKGFRDSKRHSDPCVVAVDDVPGNDECAPSSPFSSANSGVNSNQSLSGLKDPASGSTNRKCSFANITCLNKPIHLNSDDEDNNPSCSSLDVATTITQGLVQEENTVHCLNDPENPEVFVIPDAVAYGLVSCEKPVLTFSKTGIQLEAAKGLNRPLKLSWNISDIIKIESMWNEHEGKTTVDLFLISKHSELAQTSCQPSGIKRLRFEHSDPEWSRKEEVIKSLDVRYKAMWKALIDVSTVNMEETCGEKYKSLFSECNLSNLVESIEAFEDIIYPEGEADAVSICMSDFQLLQPEKFINDTIIDFYIKYLDSKLRPEEKHRFHFFNSFFFQKLAYLDKDPLRSFEGMKSFQHVRNWTRRVDIFCKDYIFIPVNFSLHWSLIIICHPGEVAKTKAGDIDILPKVPCILHLDSLKGIHRGLNNLIQSYLWEEWKERVGEPTEDISAKFNNLLFLPLELPQQENHYDCGLFLLHYVDLFLKQAPVNFSPYGPKMFSSFLKKDWFPPAEASEKRIHIKKLLQSIIQNKYPPKSDTLEIPIKDNEDDTSTSIEILEEGMQQKHNSVELCQSKFSRLFADLEIETDDEECKELKHKTEALSPSDRTNQPSSPTASAYVVEDSFERDVVIENIEPSDDEDEVESSEIVVLKVMNNSNHSPRVSDSEEDEQATKRARLIIPLRGRRQYARKLSKDDVFEVFCCDE
ncbi:probable ubiquitin-like-specific protease 2B isoform X2 [Impatiens glandulifera]|uniref:probable ubiquitin-like-specific protease 2B isoform X2 n=1 Tax=Impatiens glandulifera TaxID=253017 RepID=UPI001FB0CC41|nr:probable ubiquitin-like-specific protease 2B isoform X2 [Impatiens glandulifera]